MAKFKVVGADRDKWVKAELKRIKIKSGKAWNRAILKAGAKPKDPIKK